MQLTNATKEKILEDVLSPLFKDSGYTPQWDDVLSIESIIIDDDNVKKVNKDLTMILLDSIKLPIQERVKFLNEAIYHISCALHEANTHSQHDTDQQYNDR